MRKVLFAVIVLFGVLGMPINDEFVEMLKRNMPNMTPQDVQLARDYTTQIDSAVSHFGGGDTLTIDTMNANFGTWGQFPFEGVLVEKTGQQAISDATNTTVEWGHAVFQDGNAFWDSSSPTDIKIPSTGIYLMYSSIRYEQNADNARELKVFVNGLGRGGTSSFAGSGVGLYITFPLTLSLKKGDIVTIRTWQNSGVSLNIDDGDFFLYRIR